MFLTFGVTLSCIQAERSRINIFSKGNCQLWLSRL